jgi:hypothetical protein
LKAAPSASCSCSLGTPDLCYWPHHHDAPTYHATVSGRSGAAASPALTHCQQTGALLSCGTAAGMGPRIAVAEDFAEDLDRQVQNVRPEWAHTGDQRQKTHMVADSSAAQCTHRASPSGVLGAVHAANAERDSSPAQR